MRKLGFAILVVVALASSLDAEAKGRVMRFIYNFPTAEAALTVSFEDPDGNGVPNMWVSMRSLRPLTAGTTFYPFVKPAGSEEFLPLPSGGGTITLQQAGLWRTTWMFYGEGVYDTIFGKEYPAGLTRWRMVIENPRDGRSVLETTTPLPVNPWATDPDSFLRVATCDTDGKKITVLGDFDVHTVAMLDQITAPVVTEYGVTKVIVPAGVGGKNLPLTMCRKWPVVECVSTTVDVPKPQGNNLLAHITTVAVPVPRFGVLDLPVQKRNK